MIKQKQGKQLKVKTKSLDESKTYVSKTQHLYKMCTVKTKSEGQNIYDSNLIGCNNMRHSANHVFYDQ
jgi:hypothetical protein